MTAKAALCKLLLEGKVINIKNGFDWLGITNVPREIGRMIERLPDGKGSNGFGVTVSRTPMKGKSRFGIACTWINYRLNKTDYNKEGILKMKAYLKQHSK